MMRHPQQQHIIYGREDSHQTNLEEYLKYQNNLIWREACDERQSQTPSKNQATVQRLQKLTFRALALRQSE